jgi:S-(hydroxymethyl)glutathione dehydrogenase / alcohol dehydrogenase
MKTKAAVCRAFGAPLTVETVELAEPGPGEALIQTAACAICHSDIFYVDGAWGGDLPLFFCYVFRHSLISNLSFRPKYLSCH